MSLIKYRVVSRMRDGNVVYVVQYKRRWVWWDHMSGDSIRFVTYSHSQENAIAKCKVLIAAAEREAEFVPRVVYGPYPP